MNNFRMKIAASILIFTASLSFIACGGPDENSTANSPTTNEIPLIVPDNTAPVPSIDTITTIYNTWVLDSMNGKLPDSGYFAHGSPYIDFNVDNKAISGFIGCNGINGKFKVNGQRLTFDSITVTTQECRGKGKEFERKLLTGFRSGKTTYNIQNGNLHLNAGSGSNFIFRKIRS
jgi:heat shock protein HslJ